MLSFLYKGSVLELLLLSVLVCTGVDWLQESYG